MANTVIQLKHSTLTGNVPSSLANGEISINSRDGKFFYSTPAGSVVTHYPYLGPSGLNKEIQFNDSGTLGSNSGLTFDKANGIFTAPIVASSNNGNGTNFRIGDDAWIGDVNLADTLRISGQQNVNNAYIVFGASNANTLGRSGTGPLTYTGDFKATGLVSGNELTSTNSTGSEGGQVNLAIPASGTSLVSSVTIDVYGNQLRFFQGDSAKGAYIDLTATASSVGTNLLAPSSSTDGWARGQANAAFLQANTPSATANSAASYANSAFIVANNSLGIDTTQNTNITNAGTYANSAFGKANTAGVAANTPSFTANSAALYANAAFTRANNSLDANNGGTVTGTITATSFITTGSFGNITGANTIYANNFVANTGFIQFSDGSKQYTANAGSGGGGGTTDWGFGIIYTANNNTYANAAAANSQVNFVGESGVVVYANSITKTITVAGTPGAQGLTVDYGYVADTLYYAIDYGTL